MSKIIIYLGMSVFGLLIGGGSSYIWDLARRLNLDHPHGLGLENLFLLTAIGGILSQIVALILFWEVDAIKVSGIIVIAFLLVFLFSVVF